MAKDKIYQQVAMFLKESISSGKLKVGEAIYSENLLCKKLGVSRTSVRKAIRMMVEDNILESRQGKGTFIKNNGSGLRHGKLCLFNHWKRVLRYDALDNYYSNIIYGAEAETRDNELDFSIFSKPFNTLTDAKSLLSKLKYDGALIDGAFQDQNKDDLILPEIFSHSILVDGNPQETALPTAVPDAERGFLRLIDLLKTRKGPVFYLFNEFYANGRWRKYCFDRAAKNAGLEYSSCDFGKNIKADNIQYQDVNNFNHHPLIHEALKTIALPRNTQGTIVCGSDYIASKVIISLHSMGYSVPGDFAVSGFGGIPFAAYTQPALTTIKVDSFELSRLAVKMLIAKIEGKEPPCSLLDADVIRRESL